jgi:tryptophan-rich sensory protein
MKTRSAVVGSGVTAAAAVLGNVFVGKEALSWFRGLRAPRFQLPMPGFVSVAAAYYVIMAVVLARGIDRRDAGAIAWAVAVLAGNEAWNGLLFGRRTPVRPSSACWRSWYRWAGSSDRSGWTSTPAGSCCPIRPM